MLAEGENHLRFDKGVLALCSMSLPLPFRQDPLVWASIQSRQVSPYSTGPYVDRCPMIVAAISAVLFTLIVYVSSFVTAACLGPFERGVSEDSYIFSSYFYPIYTFKDLVSSTLSILNDEFGIIEHRDGPLPRSLHRPTSLTPKPDSLVVRLAKKFLLGLPLVGIGSLIQMVLSMPILGPVHWIAHYRSFGGRRGSTRDMTAIIAETTSIRMRLARAFGFLEPIIQQQSDVT